MLTKLKNWFLVHIISFYIIHQGICNTDNGSWIIYFDEIARKFGVSMSWLDTNKTKLREQIIKNKKVADVEEFNDLSGWNAFDCIFWLCYCPHIVKE